jgi:AcrR family transcriptional regulator
MKPIGICSRKVTAPNVIAYLKRMKSRCYSNLRRTAAHQPPAVAPLHSTARMPKPAPATGPPEACDTVASAPTARVAYHHDDLRQQLLTVAEQIILERGVDGFTLREAARRVGVSPAAPAHHFNDARGLLTEMALLGFREFGDALQAADEAGGTDPGRRLRGQAVAYVQFAFKHPARFQLMFRHDKHDVTNAEFVSVAERSYGILEGAIRAATNTPAKQELTPESHGLLLAVWSIVHGFSNLALGGELRNPGGGGATRDAILEALLPQLLKYVPTALP